MAECTQEQYEHEISKLTDPSVAYFPTNIFKQLVGASGPWVPNIEDQIQLFRNPLAVQSAAAEPAVEEQEQTQKATDDDVKVLGVYQEGGSSGSGSARAIPTAREQTAVSEPPAGHVSSPSAAVKSPAGHVVSSSAAVNESYCRSC